MRVVCKWIFKAATVLHHRIPIKIFIYNGGYLTIKQTQQLGFKSRIMGSDYDSGLSFPNYELISKYIVLNILKYQIQKN